MKDYEYYLEKIGEYGIVEEISYPLIILSGFKHIHNNELVISENGDLGLVFTVANDHVEILLFSQNAIKIGTQFARTDEYISVPVGESLFGWVINPLGEPYFGNGTFKAPKDSRPLETPMKGIADRVRIKEPFHTGVSLVDMIIPLGKGQKELVIGDRKAGKTSFILNIIKSQVDQNTLVIYAAIGRKKNDIKKFYEFCVKEKIQDKIVVVAASSDSSPSLIYLAPFSAMSIAEHFRDQGKNVLVILDDLSTHAKFYREISLVAQHFPGRESYPGDIFYIHARLLERSGNFKFDGNKEVSITCLPVVETVEGDLSGYIPTNIMGMTDGHIFFDSNAFYKGLRPAINIGLSVTRVGKQAQSHLQREVNHELSAFLSQYEKMESYSHFGAELSAKVQKNLQKGALLYNFFQQHYTEVVPSEVQLVIFSAIWSSLVEDKERMNVLKQKLIEAFNKGELKELFAKVVSVNSLYELLTSITLYKEQLLKLLPEQTVAAAPVVHATPIQVNQQETSSTQTTQPAQSAPEQKK